MDDKKKDYNPAQEGIDAARAEAAALGTPKNLDEAVVHAICIGPLCDVRERSYHVMKDYIAQKFGVAVLKHPEAETVLMDLFKEITKREK